MHLPGGRACLDVTDQAVYLAVSVGNVRQGLATLNGWLLHHGRSNANTDRPSPDDFHRLTRDLYVPPNDIGFWRGALRDPSTNEFKGTAQLSRDQDAMTIDMLCGDLDGE